MTDADLTASNAAVMARYRSAWEADDLARLFACYHPDFTIHYFGSNPLSGTHEGRQACLKVLAEVGRRSHRKLIEIVDILVGPQRCAVIARERFQRDGRTADLDRVLVYRLADDALRECWVYDADQATVDQFFAD